jgi:hypothetical protein
VLQSWLTNLLAGRYRAVCRQSVWIEFPAAAASPSWRPSPSQSFPSSAPSIADCADITKPVIEGQSPQSALSAERAMLLPGLAGSGKISIHVGVAQASGDSVTIDARQVTVNGRRLDKIVASHMTGVDASQFDLTFPLDRFGGSWYVGELNENLGTTHLHPATTQPG